MIHITAQMRVLVAIEAVDGRKGIDSLVRVCQEKLSEDPIGGCVFVFRSRRGTSIRLLTYDGQGYWPSEHLCHQFSNIVRQGGRIAMDQEEHRETVKRIFHSALELEAEARPAFLDSACSGDAELRRQVELLLAKE